MKVNLEKELMRQNARIALPKELLLIKEYDRLGPGVSNSEILQRVGINRSAQEGQKIKYVIDRMKHEASRFKPERVYHISQIEGLCKKYHLRFLPSNLFKGSVDIDLPSKISQFEVAYDVRCQQTNSFVVAPASSFKLKERPKDPLFFYKINDQFYYLVHKWGNDLSVFRRVYALFTNPFWCLLVAFSAILIISVPCIYFSPFDGQKLFIGLLTFFAVLLNIMRIVVDGPWLEPDTWKSDVE